MALRSRISRTHGPANPRRPDPIIPSFIDTSLVPARAKLNEAQATRQMAEDMREAAYREGGVTETGLELLGYSKGQIATIAGPARELANELAGLV